MDLKLLNKFVNNRCSSGEVDEISSWIQGPDEYSGQVILKQYWDILKSAETADDLLSHKRLDSIHHKINIQQSERFVSGEGRSSSSGRRYLRTFIYRAAVVLLIPVITLFVYTRFFQPGFIATNEIASPPGSRIFLQLSDGTKVWLNHGSKMVYPQKFSGKNRTVELSGEGYFDVAHDVSKPFIVESEGLQVKAVGTAFNVKAYGNGTDFETTLESGKVWIQKKSEEIETKVCSMSPGQHFVLNHNTNTFSLKCEEPFKYVAWKEGKLVFDDDSLNKVTELLSQWYDVEIIIKDTKLNKLTFRAIFLDESLSQIIEMMQIVMPIRCVEEKRVKTNDGVYMKKKIMIYARK
jgi:transmembrane sensor